MGRKFRIVALLLAILVVCAKGEARPAKQTWLRIQSPHFVVITDGAPSQAIDVAERFEAIRQVFLKASRMHVDSPTPVVILAVRNGQDLGKLLPAFWNTKGRAHPAGIFVSAPGRNYVALRMDVDQFSDYHVVYHEYVHLLEKLNFTSLPVWLSEGLAEFYGTVGIKRGEVDLGYPIPEHIATLKKGKWIPLDQLLTAGKSSPYYNENDLAGIFYAESWELTDYLLVGNKGTLTPELGKYLNLFQQGTPSLAAGRKAFGDLNALTKKLEKYARHPKFNYLRMNISVEPGKTNFPSRNFTPAEVDATFGDFYADTGEPADARTALNQAIQLDPKMPAPYVTLGMLAVREGDEEAELKWFSRAISLGSKSYLPYFYHANILANRSGGKALLQVKGDLTRCMELNPGFGGAYSVLAELYAESGVKLSLADALARRALELEPASSFDHLVLGMVLRRQGKNDSARAEAELALSLAHTPLDRGQAQIFMAEVGEAAVAPAASAASGTASSGAGPPSASSPGATVDASGLMLYAQCGEGKPAEFVMLANGSPVLLSAPGLGILRYSSSSRAGGEASPCSLMEGRKVAVRYRPMQGGSYDGEIQAIDLTQPGAMARRGR